MAGKERLRAIGLRTGMDVMRAAGAEVRHLRLRAGLSQARLAAAAGVSRALIGRIELGRAGRINVATLAVIYALLGQRLSLKAFPVGEPLRDAAHLRLLARFDARVPGSWRRRRESVMPRLGDLRAWDERLDGAASIGVEAETALGDMQAMERRISAKQRDSGVDHVILLVSDTHRNREILRNHRVHLRQAFPLDTREVLRALAAGTDPGGSGIVVL
jgi:transcriptional regulator with XRE-family HTH domain